MRANSQDRVDHNIKSKRGAWMDRQLEQLKAIEVEQQIKAFNEGYKLGQEAAKQIYK
jgi:hypothetical protein